THLDCSDNPLMSLDVSNNTKLTHLWCINNQLSSLNVSNNTALTWLECHNNQLISLNVSNNTALTRLLCHDNQLDANALNTIFTALPYTGGYIFIRNNPGTGTCDSSIATNKGWTVGY
ncbi:MAG: hypothetical protein LBH30_06095, partial [Prevotellaceae bacterium]|nr:hypothetical protein [Prevotellaceae bacterium]